MSKLKEKIKKVNPELRSLFQKSDQIAQLIEDKLKEKNWSKGRLAKELGARNQSIVTRYLTGQHNFTLNTLIELEIALDCSIITINENANSQAVISQKTTTTTTLVPNKNVGDHRRGIN